MQYYKIFLAYLAVAVVALSYLPYFKDIFLNKTKPHVFSWLVWTVEMSLAFAIQISQHAGSGSLVTGFSALVCLIIFTISIFKGHKQFSAFDWISLILALSALILWLFAKNPVAAILLVAAADTLGFFPSFRKVYSKPQEETAAIYGLNFIGFGLTILALESYSLTTWFYPLVLSAVNGAFYLYIHARRKAIYH